ncbi:unnamed protein product [Meganyctiphanes norvegica]|uniref:C-type lectin domain-containing protein n=1 Tax=Meganyctiphanes norvegica TaxID=48144 RepID=A0AAV2PN97_MEGNR
MKTLQPLLLLTGAGFIITTESFCPEPFWPILHECFYAFTHKKVGWHEAREQCQDMGGDLAAPRRPVLLTMDLRDKGHIENLALGGYKPSNGNWSWVSPGRRIVEKWSSGEPNIRPDGHQEEGCVHYWPDGAMPFVADYNCNSSWGFVCQYLF